MFWNTRLFITIKGIMRERNLVVLKDHIITVNWERRKELWDHHKLSEQSVSRVFGSYSQNTAFFLIFPWPWPTVPVVCMACDNHINLCCLSLSPLFFFLSLCSSVIFSNSLETQGAGKSLTNSPLPPPPPSCHMCNLSKVLSLFILMFVSPLIAPLCLCQHCFNSTHCMWFIIIDH